MQTKWNVRIYSLEKFVGLHQNSFVQLQEADDHINFQLPTNQSRVGFLIDTMINIDPNLRSAIDSVCINTNNIRDEFDGAAGFLILVCPYAKHRNERGHGSSNRQGANIFDATIKGMSSSKTGVDIRWYKRDKYDELSPDQKLDLYGWQKSNDGK